MAVPVSLLRDSLRRRWFCINKQPSLYELCLYFDTKLLFRSSAKSCAKSRTLATFEVHAIYPAKKLRKKFGAAIRYIPGQWSLLIFQDLIRYLTRTACKILEDLAKNLAKSLADNHAKKSCQKSYKISEDLQTPLKSRFWTLNSWLGNADWKMIQSPISYWESLKKIQRDFGN